MVAPVARASLVVALAAGPSSAQASVAQPAAPVAIVEEARWREAGLEAVVRDGVAGVSAVRWRRGEGAIDTIPLAVPRERVALGRAGRDVLVVLAGGVRDSLDVYLARSNGEIRRVASEGGRRLPSSFAGGLGSWPIAIGDTVFVFAYQKDERCELRAIGFGEQVFASRTLPATTTGFAVTHDGGTGQIDVVVQGPAPAETVRFVHPDAPRLRVDGGLLTFGEVTVGAQGRSAVRVTNPGTRPVSVGLRVAGNGFSIEGVARTTVAAGVPAEIVVWFEPERAGAHQGTLHIGLGELAEPLQVVLRGSAVALPPPPKVESVTDSAPTATVTPPSEPPSPEIAPSPAVVERLAPPTLRLGNGVVEVGGRAGESLWLMSVVMDAARARPLRPLATWRVRLPAAGGTLRVPLEQLGLRGEAIALLALRLEGGALRESDVLQFELAGR